MNLLFWGSISYICCRFTFGGACSSAWTFASSKTIDIIDNDDDDDDDNSINNNNKF